jgi:ubiquitin carboxyl-terminal hydrolase 25/28
MTAHDMSQYADERKRIHQDSANSGAPPSYDHVTGLAEHVTVPLQAPPEGNEEAVDIRLEDYDGQSFVPDPATTSTVAVVENPTVPPSSLWTTAARAAETAKYEVYACLATFVPAEVTRKRAASLIEPVSRTEEGASSLQPLPSLSMQDITAALPHPSALFYPDSLRWQVFLKEDEMVARYLLGRSESMNSYDPTQLWHISEDSIQLNARDQDGIVALPQLLPGSTSAAWQYVEKFQIWQNTVQSRVYCTQIDELQSVVSKSLLDTFRQERMSNPRPGLTGYQQFCEAVTTLIRIVGNAANGEVRPLTTSGKTISVKLGLDKYAEAILTSLGFQRENKPESSTIKPPDITASIWQLRMRRAWVELSLWFAHQQRQLGPPGIPATDVPCDIPYFARCMDCDLYLLERFGKGESAPPDKRNTFSASLRSCFDTLGADTNASDELLDRCYIVNSDGKTLLQRAYLLTSLVEIIGTTRKDSDILQTRVAVERSNGLFTIPELGMAFGKITGSDLQSLDEMVQVDNQFIVGVYRSTARDVASEASKLQEVKDALALISFSRDKPEVLEDALQEKIELSIDKAYEILEVQHDTDDDFIVATYQLATTESRFSAEQCTEALRVISEQRKSSTLRKVYRAALGIEEEDRLDLDPSKPAGLENIGNTCYLNSVLQYFYAIKPLRERVLSLKEVFNESQAKDVGDLRIRVGGRPVSQREVARSVRFVELLAQLFSAMMSSPSTAVTPERELAYLALVSSQVEERESEAIAPASEPTKADETDGPGLDADTVPSTNTLYEEPTAIAKTADSPDNVELDHTVDREALRSTNERHSALDKVVEIGQRKNSLMQLGAQQDVSECLDNVMFQIETALAAVAAEGGMDSIFNERNVDENLDTAKEDADEVWVADGDLLRRLFLGRTNQRLEMLGDPIKNRLSSVHMKREVFKILPIDVVEEGRDIYDGLDGFFDDEILTGTGGEAMRRMVALTDAPAVMQIQLQRVQYDRERGVYKSQAHLAMGEKLYMDRYMELDTSNPHDRVKVQKRKEAREMRRQIDELRKRREETRLKGGGTVSRCLEKTAGFLESLQKGYSILHDDEDAGLDDDRIQLGGVPTSLLEKEMNEFLRSESKLVDEQQAQAEVEMKRLKDAVETLWSDERQVEYVLASVFMHRGEASHGHYFLNQRKLRATSSDEDEEATSSWYKYNDNVVTDATLASVLKDTTGATPYLLSYVRRDLQDSISLFETVCRQIEMPTAEKSEEVQVNAPASDVNMADTEDRMDMSD